MDIVERNQKEVEDKRSQRKDQRTVREIEPKVLQRAVREAFPSYLRKWLKVIQMLLSE